MSPKEIAISFLKAASGGDVRPAFEKFVATNFIHHNQYFKGDRESLMSAMAEASLKSPNKSIEIKHVYVDGPTAITHSHVTRKNSADPEIAVVHIFRIQNDRIVELWDLGQMMIKDSPNINGMF